MPTQRKTRGQRRLGNPFTGGIPRSLSTKLHLQASYAVTTMNSGAPNQYTRWTPNDLYDPLYDAGGGQSMFRDQLYALYHYARCTGFRFKASVYSTSSYPVLCALIPKQDASAITYSTASEQPGAKLGMATLYSPFKAELTADVDSFLENRPGTSLTDDQFKQGSGAALDAKASCNVHIYFYYPWSTGSADLMVVYEVEQDARFSEVIAQALS